ncbi:hypothetical protein PSN45_002147 [Yamadazyma tenuis]|uniref:Ribosome biogenesis protein NOP53 n=1 Tax=Candida tenuis (strain ATCC 10573 / BCRC 21748 / CBS 615 / JCM 9827 / NBRC 10315 / NRRL Y-1498 / VKM Y-70) TaxID=590646 RepID=G3BBY2_CANTC|nr:P60-like protein [Yamadazyma tenuis ATCC 10573]EGV60112.1 P60-like protein [Yamadazyma tenuis ATCC 10573]WEJ94656.1 hypothetical protein PSN45_002147 [Yamadazyma tenuis]
MGSKTSRKTKRSWVKNIDIKDIEDNLEQSREKQRLVGTDAEFVIDETPSDVPSAKAAKKLKSTEILTNKSKIPALEVERNKKPSGRTITRLMKISGRIDGSTSMALVNKDGLLNVKNEDLWNEPPAAPAPVRDVYPMNLPPAKSKAKKVRPSTIDEAPITLEFEDSELHGGKSYNPSLESWKQLVNQEFGLEKIKELNRQQLIERQEMLARMLAEHESSDEEEESDHEINDPNHANDTNDFKLSANKPTELKRKTKTKRGRMLKHKKRVELEARLKDLKHQIHQIGQLDLEELQHRDTKVVDKVTKKKKAAKRLFKYNLMDAPLEVKLSDELSSNMKNIKAEGNLFYSSMINLQKKGLIEARVPVAKRSKYKPKITEKWTYKDFK